MEEARAWLYMRGGHERARYRSNAPREPRTSPLCLPCSRRSRKAGLSSRYMLAPARFCNPSGGHRHFLRLAVLGSGHSGREGLPAQLPAAA